MAAFNEAEAYEKNSSQQRKHGLNLIKLLAPEKDNKVLDFGCGTGYLTKALADLVGPEGKVVGVDPDVERLKIAKEKYCATNLEYVEGSAEEIPGEDYDIVFSNFVLHWCEDKDTILKQIAAKLKQGGKFGFICATEDMLKRFNDQSEIYGQKLRDAWASSYHPATLDDLKSIASANSFKTTKLEKFTVKHIFKGIPELVEFHRMMLGDKCDESHFNIDAMKRHFGDHEIHYNNNFVLGLLFS